MNNEHVPAAQSDVDLQGSERTEANETTEATQAQRPKRAPSPYSLVPALTLIALQFVKEEPNPFEVILLSMGSGKHRPTPE